MIPNLATEPRSVNPGYTPATGELHVVGARRSTKAGASTPATPVVAQHRRQRHQERSTKAGASTPATRDFVVGTSPNTVTAQRRPERQPRLHPGLRSTPAGATQPLNEGRSVNPGYTRIGDGVSDYIERAQRRPERQPRLHAQLLLEHLHGIGRSTKAGASTPATPVQSHLLHLPHLLAQRRPERQPRLHDARAYEGRTVYLRSTKAGASTPATRRAGLDMRYTAVLTTSLNEGRSVNPGYTVRVTPQIVHQHLSRPLNEGRSVNPGYTSRSAANLNAQWGSSNAQRRPERQPRLHIQLIRTGLYQVQATLNEGRSVNPGYTGPGVGRHRSSTINRSTKAGASTPATHRPRAYHETAQFV